MQRADADEDAVLSCPHRIGVLTGWTPRVEGRRDTLAPTLFPFSIFHSPFFILHFHAVEFHIVRLHIVALRRARRGVFRFTGSKAIAGAVRGHRTPGVGWWPACTRHGRRRDTYADTSNFEFQIPNSKFMAGHLTPGARGSSLSRRWPRSARRYILPGAQRAIQSPPRRSIGHARFRAEKTSACQIQTGDKHRSRGIDCLSGLPRLNGLYGRGLPTFARRGTDRADCTHRTVASLAATSSENEISSSIDVSPASVICERATGRQGGSDSHLQQDALKPPIARACANAVCPDGADAGLPR